MKTKDKCALEKNGLFLVKTRAVTSKVHVEKNGLSFLNMCFIETAKACSEEKKQNLTKTLDSLTAHFRSAWQLPLHTTV
jgi:hypothetical protein